MFFDPDQPMVMSFERGLDSCAVFQLVMVSVISGLLLIGGLVMLIVGCCVLRRKLDRDYDRVTQYSDSD
jgi:hypothetical protein